MDFTIDRTTEESHMQLSLCLSKLLKEFNLLDMWRVKNPTVRQYTWVKVESGLLSLAESMYLNKTLAAELWNVLHNLPSWVF